MILFKEDWYKPENVGAVIHYDTSNKSALRLAGLIKYMGYENHSFFLALHNPKLAKVDPHSENLTLEEKSMIAHECSINFWYYIREVALVPSPAGNEKIQFNFNRANIALFWLFFCHITTLIIQPRQTGKSLSINELVAYLLNMGTENSDLSYLTKDDKLRIKTSANVREIIDLLPDYLKFINKKDIKNSERVTVRAWNNVLNIYVGRTDKKAADNTGRGMTTPIVIIDEFGYIPNIDITLPVILSASTAAREVAERAGVPYGTIFATTPGKLYDRSGKFAKTIYDGSLRWTEAFYDLKNRTELESVVNKNTVGANKVGAILLEFNHRQLGFTDAWLMRRMQAAMSKGEDAKSDFLNQWIGTGNNSPISKDLIEVIRKSENKNPRTEISPYGYVIRWYLREDEIEKLLQTGFITVGSDTSDAVGQDGMSLIFRSSVTGEVIGAGDYNETNLTVFSEFVASILVKYSNIILIMERKSSASAIIDNIITILHAQNINPFRKMFNWVYNDKERYIGKADDLFSKNAPDFDLISRYRNKIGFGTSGGGRTSRSNLYGNVFNSSVKYTGNKVRDPLLIHQILGLTIKNGRVDHETGEHDDLVIGWLLAYWFLVSGQNKSLYGLKDNNILQEVINAELLTSGTKEDIDNVKKQEALRHAIDSLVKRLQIEKNDQIGLRILNKIRILEKQIDTKIIKNFNLDNLLKEIKIMKRLERLEKNKHNFF